MTRPTLIFCLVVSAVVFVRGQSQEPPIFRAASETVPVYVTVTDRENRLVPNLTREAFQVFDNGKAQTVTVFDNTPQPVRLQILLDVSGSMAGNLPVMREASLQLLRRLRPDDKVRVGTFGHEIDLGGEFTSDATALRAALPQDVDPNAPTPLWKAVDLAVQSFGEEGGRHVVLVLSDGQDSPAVRWGERFVGQLDVVDRAHREDVMIYGIGMQARHVAGYIPGMSVRDRMVATLPDPGLGTAAEATGGGYFEIGPRDNLNAAFARVADELHSQYLMGFTPSQRDGKMHKVEVRLVSKDLKPRTRKQYRAPK